MKYECWKCGKLFDSDNIIISNKPGYYGAIELIINCIDCYNLSLKINLKKQEIQKRIIDKNKKLPWYKRNLSLEF